MKASTVATLAFLGFGMLSWLEVFSDRLQIPLYGHLLIWTAQLILITAAYHFNQVHREESARANPDRPPVSPVARRQILILATMPLTAFAAPFLFRLSSPNIPVRISIYAGLSMGVALTCLVTWILKQRAVRLAEQKPTIAAIALVALALAGANISMLIRSRAIESIGRAMAEANSAREKTGGTISSAEAYIAALKAIDTGYAPSNFQSAFSEYIQGSDEIVQAAKNRDRAGMTTGEARTTAAKERLVAIASKY